MKEKNIFNNLDWENFQFPLILSDIKLENGLYKLKESSVIKIWRNSEFKLVGEIKGVIDNEKNLQYNQRDEIIKKVILQGDNIICKSKTNVVYKIRNCLIGNQSYKNNKKENNYVFKASLTLESVVRYNKDFDKIHSIIDWHICSSNLSYFPKFTTRYFNKYPYKFRDGIDIKPKENNIDNIHSWEVDFFTLKISDLTVIIQKISTDYLPEWSKGIAIEYRSDLSSLPNSKIRRSVGEFISFILGVQLLNIGSSHLNKDVKNIENYCNSPWGNNVISICNSKPFPPFDFYSISETMLNHLFLNYLILRDKYDFRDILWKLWIGRVQALGTNLPILASGIDTLVNNYINEKGIIKKFSKSEKSNYRKLIKPELTSLEVKLQKYQFKSFVLNKLNNPFNYGIGEKIKLFLDDIGFIFDENSIESKALKARNKMTHGTMSNTSDSEIVKSLRLTNAYITIYNRIILKILDYNGYYIDYYHIDHLLIKLEDNIPFK